MHYFSLFLDGLVLDQLREHFTVLLLRGFGFHFFLDEMLGLIG